jgi:hypothetical protein
MKTRAGGSFDVAAMADVPDPLGSLRELPALPRRPSLAKRPPTRADAAAMQRRALGGAVLYELLWLVLLNKRGDIHTIRGHTLLLEVAVPLAAAAIGLAAATARGGRGLGAAKPKLAVGALLAPTLFLAATVALAPHDVDPERFAPHALRCFALTAAFTAGPLALAAHVFRGAFAAAPAWRSAALAMACAALAAVTTALACSVGSAAHVIVGHGSMMLVAGAIGAVVGRRLAQA